MLLPLLAAAEASAQTAAPAPLPSKTFAYEDLPVKKSGENTSRAIFNGTSYDGCPIEMHMTELPPGGAPHPPHHHLHNEMILVLKGTMAVTISGKTANIGPGSSAFVASNEEHGWKNIGAGNAQYWVVAIGKRG